MFFDLSCPPQCKMTFKVPQHGVSFHNRFWPTDRAGSLLTLASFCWWFVSLFFNSACFLPVKAGTGGGSGQQKAENITPGGAHRVDVNVCFSGWKTPEYQWVFPPLCLRRSSALQTKATTRTALFTEYMSIMFGVFHIITFPLWSWKLCPPLWVN